MEMRYVSILNVIQEQTLIVVQMILHLFLHVIILQIVILLLWMFSEDLIQYVLKQQTHVVMVLLI